MTTLYRRRPEVAHRSLEETVFLARPGADSVQRLNPTGSALWRLLAEPVGVEEAADTFLAAFPGQPRARLMRQLSDLLTALVEDGLVEPLAREDSTATRDANA